MLPGPRKRVKFGRLEESMWKEFFCFSFLCRIYGSFFFKNYLFLFWEFGKGWFWESQIWSWTKAAAVRQQLEAVCGPIVEVGWELLMF